MPLPPRPRQAGAAPTEETPKLVRLVNFKGMNTQATRTAINDDEFSWLENVMPIGNSNMKIIPGLSAELASWAPDVAQALFFADINDTPYVFVPTTVGSLWQVRLTDYTTTKIAAAGTLSNANVQITQWKNSRILIMDASKGYFTYDGTLLTANGGVVVINVTNGGTGYTSAPTVVFSTGTATATATVSGGSVVSITITNPGSGYTTAPTISFSGGGGSAAAATAIILQGPAFGNVQAITITNGGTGYTSAPTVAITGGGGSGATATATISSGVVTGITITNQGTGYTSNPVVTFSGGAGTGAAATATVVSVPTQVFIAVYEGRVWVAAGRTLIYSAPNSFYDFTTSDAGGIAILTDSTLISNIQALRAANDYLYIVGESSINIISDVRVTGTPPITLFTNTVLVTGIGSNIPFGCTDYLRSLIFITPNYGVYVLTGATPQKISAELDGIYPLLTPINITVAQIYGNFCICILATYADPVLGSRVIQLLFYQGKWFVASTDAIVLTFAVQAVVSGDPVTYCSQGTHLHQLFTNTASAIAYTIETKLYDMGTPTFHHQALHLGVEVSNAPGGTTINATMDSEDAANPYTLSIASFVWTNISGSTVVWTNTYAATFTWYSSNQSPMLKSSVSQIGYYLGCTLTGSSTPFTFNSINFDGLTGAQW